ncbi:ATP synthase protein I [Palleronia aestuarii]|uniref:ATP synthase protein I n=1 Tax=Palleronia aestuarii TaxID=568105 RepID=A0A2W7N6M8_9RHOB|nr:AtpZ/AtpI family protein [Palleronia aestuarii]PZX15751.1 ATP synthase protein I [Palleronia aestuarii]
MVDDATRARMEALEKRLAAARRAQDPGPRSDEHYSMANMAWRMVTELVAGLLIGLGIGYGLDTLFGTLPLFLVLFVLLGLAAGVNVMLRTAKEIQADAERAPRDREEG